MVATKQIVIKTRAHRFAKWLYAYLEHMLDTYPPNAQYKGYSIGKSSKGRAGRKKINIYGGIDCCFFSAEEWRGGAAIAPRITKTEPGKPQLAMEVSNITRELCLLKITLNDAEMRNPYNQLLATIEELWLVDETQVED